MQADKAHFYHLAHKKLSGEASNAELQELEHLLRTHPDWHYMLDQLTALWRLPARPAPRAAAEAAFDRHLQRLQLSEEAPVADADKQKAGGRKMFTIPFGIAAACAVAAAVLFVLFLLPGALKGKTSVLTNEVYAHAGAKTKVALPDGTVVWLNAGSKLSYDNEFGKAQRKVTLVGEGYFDVAANKAKPFVVQTQLVQVKVLGTIFNLKAYPQEAAEASLIEGSIQALLVTQKENEVIVLKPKQKLIVPQRGLPPAQQNSKVQPAAALVAIVQPIQFNAATDSTPVETAWLHNKLVFNNESFSTLAHRLERWYGVAIKFEDSAVQQLRFTGSFQQEDLQQVLKALKITGRFSYTIHNDSVFISSNP